MTDKKSKDKADKKIAKLEKKMEGLQKEKDETFAQLQRISADYANFQKRSSKQIDESVRYEKERIIKSLLPGLDNFEHTLKNMADADDAHLKGVQIVYDQMLDILKSHNVEQIKALGEKFDPNMHQAMMRKTDDEAEDNIVLEEFQKGYELNGRVIRPCMVVVNKLGEEESQEAEENDEE